mmetsp:Transcript_25198/g.52351  ORF Transcript_25198/g.52351 Transcript_25198/m.52351 type:complete len:312 (-) Transcript_25198:31-966(-)
MDGWSRGRRARTRDAETDLVPVAPHQSFVLVPGTHVTLGCGCGSWISNHDFIRPSIRDPIVLVLRHPDFVNGSTAGFRSMHCQGGLVWWLRNELAIPFCHSERFGPHRLDSTGDDSNGSSIHRSDPIDPLLQEERDGRVQGTKEGTIDSKSIHRRNQYSATMDPIQYNPIQSCGIKHDGFHSVVWCEWHTHTLSFRFRQCVCVCVCVHGGSVVPCRSLTRRTRRNSKPIPVPAFLSLRCFYDRDVVWCGVSVVSCCVNVVSCRVVSCKIESTAGVSSSACLPASHPSLSKPMATMDRSIDRLLDRWVRWDS